MQAFRRGPVSKKGALWAAVSLPSLVGLGVTVASCLGVAFAAITRGFIANGVKTWVGVS